MLPISDLSICMTTFDEVKQYLPKYLSDDALNALFENLKQFPENINDRLYSGILSEDDDVFQGDGLSKMLVVDLPDPKIRQSPVMIVSNTCDTSVENSRMTSPTLIYCPIIRLSKYVAILKEEGIAAERIDARVEQIKRQRVSDIFYLPYGGGLPEDCISFLERANSCNIEFLKAGDLKERRLFSLSNYGFYLFIFKLGIHFTRVHEAVERG